MNELTLESTKINGTPLAVSTYSVESSPTKMNSPGTLEIIFCLKGTVHFSYAYEEFTLNAGEFVSVDRDAYYLYKGRRNQCVSFTIDLTRYEEKYPYIRPMLFVCEGMQDGTSNHPKALYSWLKGLLISLLMEITSTCDSLTIQAMLDRIVDFFVEHFNIYFYHYGSQEIGDEILGRLNQINDYIYQNVGEKITLADLSRDLNLSPGYVSELMRRYSVGFRKMLAYIRANASEKFLLDTDRTIVEISEACGFSDPKYYYAAFRDWYRCTPRQFRERYGKSRPASIEYLPLGSIRSYLDELQKQHYREIFVPSLDCVMDMKPAAGSAFGSALA